MKTGERVLQQCLLLTMGAANSELLRWVAESYDPTRLRMARDHAADVCRLANELLERSKG